MRLDEGGFIVNRNNYLEMKRPNRSTLVVVDQYGTEVLNMRYINEKALKINGLLAYPGLGDIPLEPRHLRNFCAYRRKRTAARSNDKSKNSLVTRLPSPGPRAFFGR